VGVHAEVVGPIPCPSSYISLQLMGLHEVGLGTMNVASTS
jgi:hypothetical protein